MNGGVGIKAASLVRYAVAVEREDSGIAVVECDVGVMV